MKEQNPVKSEEEKRIQHLATLLVKSFEFSQGGEDLQRLLFEYLHTVNPELQISDKNESPILYRANCMIGKMFGTKEDSPPFSLSKFTDGKIHHSISTSYIPKVLEREFPYYKTPPLHSPKSPHALPLHIREAGYIMTITASIISRDIRFLRKGRTRNGITPLSFDPYASHLRIYAGQEKPTGTLEFNKMFSDIRLLTKEGLKKPEMMSALWNMTELSSLWEEKHPGERFLEPFEEN